MQLQAGSHAYMLYKVIHEVIRGNTSVFRANQGQSYLCSLYLNVYRGYEDMWKCVTCLFSDIRDVVKWIQEMCVM